jgi:hypothetical protein
MQPRIVIDFDADDSGAAPAPARTLSAPTGAAEAASAGNGKPADMLRAIQSMRLTLKRLEQQKAASNGGGAAAGPTLDKQATLLAQASGLAGGAGKRGRALHCRASLQRAGLTAARPLWGARAARQTSEADNPPSWD